MPLGILWVIRLIPAEVMAEARAAATNIEDKPASRAAAAVIVCIWIAAAGLLAWLFWADSVE